MRSNVPAHWTGFAVAHHLGGNITMALSILKQYEATLPVDRKPDLESNGMKLYCVLVSHALFCVVIGVETPRRVVCSESV